MRENFVHVEKKLFRHGADVGREREKGNRKRFWNKKKFFNLHISAFNEVSCHYLIYRVFLYSLKVLNDFNFCSKKKENFWFFQL